MLVVSWNQQQVCKDSLEAIGYNIVCCAGSDSHASSSETSEVSNSRLSDSRIREPQSCDSSIQVMSNSYQLPQLVSLLAFH